ETFLARAESLAPCSIKAPPGVGHHARGARHAVSPETPPREGGSSPPNVGNLSSHQGRETCVGRPTHERKFAVTRPVNLFDLAVKRSYFHVHPGHLSSGLCARRRALKGGSNMALRKTRNTAEHDQPSEMEVEAEIRKFVRRDIVPNRERQPEN